MVSFQRLRVIVFLASEKRELSGFAKHLTDIKGARVTLDYAHEAQLRGEPVLLAANGSGFRLAREGAESIANAYSDIEAFVTTGFCGGLDPSLEAGEVVVGTEIGGEEAAVPGTDRKFRSGAVLSQDRVADCATEKAGLARTGAIAVEMEAGGVAAYVRSRNIPFFCVKVVTDTARESFPIDFNRMRDSRGAFSRARIARAALRHPFLLFPRLMELDRKCKKAAAILGDFLADCRY